MENGKWNICCISKRLHPRRRIAGGAHRVTDPYGKAKALYKRAEPYDAIDISFIPFSTFIIFHYLCSLNT